jgi:hypothetical protein
MTMRAMAGTLKSADDLRNDLPDVSPDYRRGAELLHDDRSTAESCSRVVLAVSSNQYNNTTIRFAVAIANNAQLGVAADCASIVIPLPPQVIENRPGPQFYVELI